MAKNCLEGRVVKGQSSAVGYDPSEVGPPERSRVVASRRKALRFEIYTDDSTRRHCLSQTHRDRRLTASAIEDDHVRPKVRKKKAGVDVRAARLDRGLNPASSLRFFH
jgi:hypothetical protein